MKTTLVKVPCQKDAVGGYALCVNKLLEYCYYYNGPEGTCSHPERYPACLKEGIIWLEVKDD